MAFLKLDVVTKKKMRPIVAPIPTFTGGKLPATRDVQSYATQIHPTRRHAFLSGTLHLYVAGK
jgi:hypothetical protein